MNGLLGSGSEKTALVALVAGFLALAVACGSDGGGGGAAGNQGTSGQTAGGASNSAGQGQSGDATTSAGAAGAAQGGAPSAGSGGTSGPAGSGGVAGQAQSGGGGTSGAAGAGGGSGVLRIMALGDSITRSTCWRALLWQRLDQNFRSRFDFVGSLQSDTGCMPTGYDRDNQGYGSSLVTEIAGVSPPPVPARVCDPGPCPSLNDLRTIFVARPADVVLMHFGTNDAWNNRSAADITMSYSLVIDALRAGNPNVTVLLAQIIPLQPVATTACPGCACPDRPGRVTTLNGMLPAFATTKSNAQSRVILVDQAQGFNAAVGMDTVDGVHPNASGSMKMADKWYAALTQQQLIR